MHAWMHAGVWFCVCVCLVCALCVPCVCLVCAWCVPGVCLVCALCVPCVCLVCALCVPFPPTHMPFPPHTHWTVMNRYPDSYYIKLNPYIKLNHKPCTLINRYPDSYYIVTRVKMTETCKRAWGRLVWKGQVFFLFFLWLIRASMRGAN